MDSVQISVAGELGIMKVDNLLFLKGNKGLLYNQRSPLDKLNEKKTVSETILCERRGSPVRDGLVSNERV